MNAEFAEYLIALDKYVLNEGEPVRSFLMNITYPLNIRLLLSTPDDLDQNLIVDIKESAKKSLKINLHHQENSTQNGLLRVDYNGRHQNPPEITPALPAVFHPFAGLWLDEYAGHIHYVVDGYKPLVWAIPLDEDDFPVKKLNSREDYTDTLNAFFQKINLKTVVQYNQQITMLL